MAKEWLQDDANIPTIPDRALALILVRPQRRLKQRINATVAAIAGR